MRRILVSACLLGQPVRYDGGARTLAHRLLDRWHEEGRLVAVCPELIAGFPTPRPPAEIDGDGGTAVLDGQARIVEDGGRDMTEMFVAGAERTLEIARANECACALLTDGSPSCGSAYIYDGSFEGRRKAGQGVVTALLARNGIRVFPESAIEALAAEIDGDG